MPWAPGEPPRREGEEKARKSLAWSLLCFPNSPSYLEAPGTTSSVPHAIHLKSFQAETDLQILLLFKALLKLSATPDSFQLWGVLDIRADLLPACCLGPGLWCSPRAGWEPSSPHRAVCLLQRSVCDGPQRPRESSTFLPAMLIWTLISEELTWG